MQGEAILLGSLCACAYRWLCLVLVPYWIFRANRPTRALLLAKIAWFSFAVVAIDLDWRAQVRAELALGGGLERLSDAERASIEEGRSFEAIFNSASNVRPLPWRLPGGQCDIAWGDGDPNPWCR